MPAVLSIFSLLMFYRKNLQKKHKIGNKINIKFERGSTLQEAGIQKNDSQLCLPLIPMVTGGYSKDSHKF